jgi:hypothetical protein
VLVDVAWTVNVKVPVLVGVPESDPEVESVIPDGRLPLVFAKVYGLVLPLAVIVWL